MQFNKKLQPNRETDCATLLVGILLLAAGAGRTSAFEVFVDRAAWQDALGNSVIVTDTLDNPISGASTILFDAGITSRGFGGLVCDLSFDNAVGNGLYSANLDTDDSSVFDFFNEFRWEFPEPVIAFGGDYLLSTRGCRLRRRSEPYGLCAFDIDSGDSVWQVPSSGMNFSSAQRIELHGETLAVFGDSGGLFAVDHSKGRSWAFRAFGMGGASHYTASADCKRLASRTSG